MQKKLHIHLVACSPEQSPMAYPLGALCIQTALLSDSRLTDRIEVSLSHFLADTHDPFEAAHEIAGMQVSVVGISLYLYNRPWFEQFWKQLRSLRKDIHLFAGGPETMADPRMLLESGIDMLILGEGEETVCDAMVDILDGRVPEGRGIQTSPHQIALARHPSDLSSLTSPLLSGIADPSAFEGVLWEMTRGCPYHCAFCFESRGNRSVRTYPEERLRRELKLLIDHGVEHVFVLDPTFNMQRERTVRMLTMLRDMAPEAMHFTFEVRAELLTDEIASLFGQFHCSLQIGLQSSDPEVLKTIGRRFNPDLFAQKIDLLNRHKVVFGLDLIIGLPGDTLASFENSLDFAILRKPSNLDIFLLALLPGTQLALDADKFQLVHLTESPYLLQSSPSMDEADIAKALRLKEACDLLYTAGRAVMWTHAACDALGMRPSRWFSEFADFMEVDSTYTEEDIFTVQDAYVRHQFTTHGLSHLLSAMLSFMELHQGIAHLQDTGESPMVRLSYPPDILALLDTMDLNRFVEEQEPFDEPVEHMVFIEDDTLFIEPIQ